MQYAKMVDLLAESQEAGESEFDADALLERFRVWLGGECLGEITDEEHDALFSAFWDGFAQAALTNGK